MVRPARPPGGGEEDGIVVAIHRGVQLATLLLAGAALTPASQGGPPACTRVQPGPGFRRVIVDLPAGEAAAPGVVGVATTPSARSGLEILAVHEMDLSGSGTKVRVAVEGTVLEWFSTLYFPRILRRLDDSAGSTPWSQELPGGLFGLGEVEDVDGDGQDDLHFSSFNWILHFLSPGAFQIFWGQGDGPLAVGSRTRSSLRLVRFEDVTGDGLRDAIVGGELHTIYPAVSPRTFDEGIRYTTLAAGVYVDEPGRKLQVGDLDEDGLDDVLAITQYQHTHSLGFARGDGTFDLRPLPLPGEEPATGTLHDLDTDGHLDLVLDYGWLPGTGVHVGWGRGDGTFEPYVFLSFGEPFSGLEIGDVNGDGQDDLVVVFRDSPDPLLTRLAVFPMRGRAIAPAVPFEISSWPGPLRLADVNGDGLVDAVFVRGRSREPQWLAWKPSLGDGRFGDVRDLLDRPFAGTVDDIVPTDFDLDGSVDLFVRLGVYGPSPNVNLSLRGDGRGRFEIVSRIQSTVPYKRDLLVDVDADGRPDLVSRKEFEQYDGHLTYPMVIRRGDGLGGFLPPMPERWLSFAGVPGRFRTTGTRDLARIGHFGEVGPEIFGGGVFQLEVNPSTGFVFERD